MWFSKVPGYIFDKQKTPYLTEAKDLTLAQSQYELAAYGVFVGSLYGIVGLAATLTYFKNNDPIYLGWLVASVAVIYSIFAVVRKYELIGSYIISVAPWKYILDLSKSNVSIQNAHFGLTIISKNCRKIAVLSDFQIFQKMSSKSEFCV